MAARQKSDTIASNKEDGLSGARAEALAAYLAWLEGGRYRSLRASSTPAEKPVKTANRA